jgi:hypothetical protein
MFTSQKGGTSKYLVGSPTEETGNRWQIFHSPQRGSWEYEEYFDEDKYL